MCPTFRRKKQKAQKANTVSVSKFEIARKEETLCSCILYEGDSGHTKLRVYGYTSMFNRHFF